jgi:16S rRNA (guanine966-N2)-methyltransferase
MIRVISGRFKGKRLRHVASERVRPMPNKLKETLFDIIQDRVKNAVFMDGFSGTGSVGIEALSRGARVAVFVEQFPPALKAIRINLERCQAEEQGLVLPREFNRAVIDLSKQETLFDLIFLDPPYRLLDKRNPLKVIHKRGILAPEGLIVLRHHFKTDFSSTYFTPGRRSRIGDDVLVFYTYP